MSDIASQFKTLQDAAPRMRLTTAKERADRLRSIWDALLERKDDIFKSGQEERRTNDVDVAAELVMIKGELDFTIKNLEKWMVAATEKLTSDDLKSAKVKNGSSYSQIRLMWTCCLCAMTE